MEHPEQIPEGKELGVYKKFMCGAEAIRTVAQAYTYTEGYYRDDSDEGVSSVYKMAYPEDQRRTWHLDLQQTELHAAVMLTLQSDWRPRDWHLLLLEWPTASTDGRLAYTRDERAGKNGAPRTVTTPARYIKRHFPQMEDHVIRDVVARTGVCIEIWHHWLDIVKAAEKGPSSCMQWGISFDWDDPDPAKWEEGCHPYEAYSPEYGWRVAVRLEAGRIMARALLLHHSRGPYVAGEETRGVFVRSFRRTDNYSPTDEALEAHLNSIGYSKETEWPDGARLKFLEPIDGGDFAVPYLDGNTQRVSWDGAYRVTIDSVGEYLCNNTSGSYDHEEPNTRECSCCGDSADADDGIWVGEDQEEWVGDCCSGSYRYVRGRSRARYHVHEDNVVRVRDRGYHEEYLEDNDIVKLADGEYEHTDNAWQDDSTGDWYSVNTDPVIVNGGKYHEDSVEEVEINAETGETETRVRIRVVKDPLTQPLFEETSASAPSEPVPVDELDVMHSGAPPENGWWCTLAPNPERFSNPGGLFRHWDGARWSRDVGAGEDRHWVEREKDHVALAPQDQIQWSLRRPPWEMPRSEYSHHAVNAQFRYRPGVSGDADVCITQGSSTDLRWFLGQGSRNAELCTGEGYRLAPPATHVPDDGTGTLAPFVPTSERKPPHPGWWNAAHASVVVGDTSRWPGEWAYWDGWAWTHWGVKQRSSGNHGDVAWQRGYPRSPIGFDLAWRPRLATWPAPDVPAEVPVPTPSPAVEAA